VEIKEIDFTRTYEIFSQQISAANLAGNWLLTETVPGLFHKFSPYKNINSMIQEYSAPCGLIFIPITGVQPF